jgi:uncharacterized membrane protein
MIEEIKVKTKELPSYTKEHVALAFVMGVVVGITITAITIGAYFL